MSAGSQPLLCQGLLQLRMEKGEISQGEAWEDREGGMGLSPVICKGYGASM